MKKIIVAVALFVMGSIVHSDSFNMAEVLTSKLAKEIKNQLSSKAREAYTDYVETPPVQNAIKRKEGVRRLQFPIDHEILFSEQNCNKVIHDPVFDACYLYDEKISLMVGYELESELLKSGYVDRNKNNLTFFEDQRIPRQYRAHPYDYSRQNLDRGHSRPHASTAWDAKLAQNTYSMVNVWGQTPKLNRQAWLKAERFERQIAHRIGKVKVLNIADINGAKRRVGKNNVLVPVGFYKIVYNQEKDYQRCFYYENTNDYTKKDTLKSHLIDCEKVYY
ncbi:MAG TPA: hypothetical protein ENN12_03230 [Epsilonproteobacteria bacterium]|nr:hypothetical protein [Campylobacterota bacterium]